MTLFRQALYVALQLLGLYVLTTVAVYTAIWMSLLTWQWVFNR